MVPPIPPPNVETLIAQAPWMHALARDVLGDAALAEEAVQETVLAALRRPPHAASEAGLRSWLAAVLLRLARRSRRRELRRREAEERAARGERTADASAACERIELQRDLACRVGRSAARRRMSAPPSRKNRVPGDPPSC